MVSAVCDRPPSAVRYLLGHILEHAQPRIGERMRFSLGASLGGGGGGDLGRASDPGELAVVLTLLLHRHLHLLGTPGFQLLHLLGDHGLVPQVQFEQGALVLGAALSHRLRLTSTLLGNALLHLGECQGMLALAGLRR